MFKRVQKRQRKQEKEEELGLDSEMKEILGLQDTDSEESDSGSDDGSDNSDSEVEGGNARIEATQDDEELEEEDLMESAEGSEDEDGIPPMSVTEAVSDPLYLVSMDPEVHACILCPGKLLKNPRMSDVHKSSKAHSRRFTKFVELVGKTGPEGHVRDLIRILNKQNVLEPETREEGALSKRALKRKEKTAALKAKREKSKKIAARKRKHAEKEKEKKSAASSNASKSPAKSESNQPPKKKRKVEEDESVKTAVEKTMEDVMDINVAVAAELTNDAKLKQAEQKGKAKVEQLNASIDDTLTKDNQKGVAAPKKPITNLTPSETTQSIEKQLATSNEGTPLKKPRHKKKVA